MTAHSQRVVGGGSQVLVDIETDQDAKGCGVACSSFVTGDRLCTRCGYSLVGQSVFREPHYDLLIVRCPECGTVAGVQEYPLLGAWAHRWGLVAAALWFLFILAAWAGASGAIFAFAYGPAEQAAWDYGEYLEQLHSEYEDLLKQQQAQVPPQTPGQSASSSTQTSGPTVIRLPGGIQTIIPGGSTGDFQKWWQQQDRKAILASAGGWAGVIDWTALLFWVPGSVIGFLIGGFWALVLVPVRRRWLLVWGLFILALAWLYAIAPLQDWSRPTSWPYRAAQSQVSPGMLLLNLTFYTIPLACGLLLGRSVARLGVRSLLAPRLRHSLAILWTTDGKQPPVSGRFGQVTAR